MELLGQAGVGGMTGPTRLDALGQYVIPRVIGPDDLRLLTARVRQAARDHATPSDG